MAGGPARRLRDTGLATDPTPLNKEPTELALYDFSARFLRKSDQVDSSSVTVRGRAGQVSLPRLLPAMHSSSFPAAGQNSNRFHGYRPLAKPNLIGFESRSAEAPANAPVAEYHHSPEKDTPVRTKNGFFPPVKLRSPVSDGTKSQRGLSKQIGSRKRPASDTPPFVFELALEPMENGYQSSLPSVRSSGCQVTHSQFYTYPPVYPHLDADGGATSRAGIDLTRLPRPKRLLSRGDVPWVYRYKVKKSMNELSKIMASKPVNNSDRTLYYPLF